MLCALSAVSRYTKAVERNAIDGGDGYAPYSPPTAVFPFSLFGPCQQLQALVTFEGYRYRHWSEQSKETTTGR
jgi:hypothetical protein